jgi:Ca-activated chloride channel homolog
MRDTVLRLLRRTRLIAVCFVLSTSLLRASASPGSGATPHCAPNSGQQQSGHILRSEVNLQTIDVQVKDKSGNDVHGLVAKDFTVREDGKRQDIAFFDAGAAPVTVAVLVDSSVSVSENGNVGSAEQVAAEFMRIARPNDDIYAMGFTEHTGTFEHLTAKQLRSPGPVTLASAGGSGSAVYDAIASAICHLSGSKNPRQAIIVVTDGVDEHSRLTLNQLIDVVRSQRAQLFLIGLHSKPQFRFQDRIDPTVTLITGHDIDNPDYAFYRLEKEAGAATFVLNSENVLQKALKAVSTMLNAEYTLAYYPPPTPRKLRKIEVKVDQRGMRALASRSMVSSQGPAEVIEYLPGACAVSPMAYPYAYESRIDGKPDQQTYRDNFSDPHSGWPVHSDSHYVSSGYELSTAERAEPTAVAPAAMIGEDMGPTSSQSARVTQYRPHVIAAYGPPWPDFRVSATMRADYNPRLHSDTHDQFAGTVRAEAGLVFRITWEGYYALLVSPAVENKRMLTFELVARTFAGDSYSESVIVPWTTVPHDSPFQAQLAVQDVGDQITVFIDGQQVGIARDDTFNAGYAGFIVSAPAHAIFSDFVLEQK